MIFDYKVNLPKIYVVGDSISMHYGPYLEKKLENICRYDRKRGSENYFDGPDSANGGDSNMVLEHLKELLKKPDFEIDYLLVNCGLHDIKRYKNYSTTQVSLEQYSKNLVQIICISKELKAKLIWMSSTPVEDAIHNKIKSEYKRYNQDLINYNNTAAKIMKQKNISLIDLYVFTKELIPRAYKDHVHYNDETRKKQASFIAGKLIELIKR